MTTLLEFPRFGDARGLLAFLEGGRHVPFQIGQVQWWRDPSARQAGEREAAPMARVIFSIAGSLAIRLGDEAGDGRVDLGRPDRGVLIPAGCPWSLLEASHDSLAVTVSAADPEAQLDGARGEPARAMATVRDARLIDLPVSGADGSVTLVRGGREVPFGVARLYHLFGVPQHMSRGSHAHKKLQQLVVGVAGAFDIRLDDGISQRIVRLDRPDKGLYVPRLLWRDLMNFSPGAVCLVLASLPYDSSDYIRDYQEYRAHRVDGATVRGAR
jgi:hypothetical protein